MANVMEHLMFESRRIIALDVLKVVWIKWDEESSSQDNGKHIPANRPRKFLMVLRLKIYCLSKFLLHQQLNDDTPVEISIEIK